MRSQSRTCLLIISLHLLSFLSAQEAYKRAPQGFLGMRGKKYSEEREFFKRRPQFFVGVKGKKNYQDMEDNFYKRAPMGFVGMRGKKEFENGIPPSGSLIGQIDYTAERPEYDYLKQMIASYIQSLATPDPYSIEYPTYSAEENADNGTSEITNEVDKRANLKQFYGVRGKKSIQNKRPFDLNFRGKFIGVRGKKDDNMKEIKFLLDHNEPWPKRKGQMSGFFGMRGKKWAEDSSEEYAE